MWGMFLPSTDDQGVDRDEWQRQQEQRQQERQKTEEQRKATCLSPEKRDKYYRQLLGQLELHPTDYADLKHRGLTDEQIKAAGFKSVKQWQKLSFELPHILPGVNLDQKSLNTQEGYLCPIYDVDRLLVGFQVRMRKADEGGRYRWLSSKTKKRPNGATAHLPNGENPIAVARPLDGILRTGIGAGEGILKPFIASQRLGYPVIGAAGGQFGSSPDTLKYTLEVLSEELNTTIVDFYPDSGAIEGKDGKPNEHVLRQYQKTFKLLSDWGYTIRIGWWGQITKDQPDIDELDDLSAIAFITPDEFLAMAFERGYVPPKELDDYKARDKAQWRKLKKFTPTHTISSRYFDWEVPKANTLTAIRSGLGTGKTEYIRRLIKSPVMKNDPFIALGAINSLLLQTAERWGFYHLREHDGTKMIRDPHRRLCSCIDSIIKFLASDFDDVNLILDELSAIIEALLSRNTAIARWRDLAKHLFKEALRRAKRIICLDGNLKDWEVDFLVQLADRPDLEVLKIENQYRGSGFKVKFYEGKRSETKDLMFRHTTPFASCSDSQIELEALDGMFGFSGIRVDGKTAPDMGDFFKDPSGVIENQQPKYLSYSPSVQNGLDISIRDYFTDQYCHFFGVISVDQQMQMLARIRDEKCIRHVWCSSKPNPSNEISRSPHPEKISATWDKYLRADMEAVIEGRDNEEALRELFNELREQHKDEFYQAECKLQAIRNYEQKYPQECLLEALQSAGHDVEIVTSSGDPLDDLTEAKKHVRASNARDIFNARNLEPDEVTRLEGSDINLKWDDRCAIEKAKLKQRLPDIQYSDSWSADLVEFLKYKDRGFIGKIENYYLLRNPEFAKSARFKKWLKWDEQGQIDPKQIKSKYLFIKTLLDLDFAEFLNSEVEWQQDDSKIQKFWKACKRSSTALKLNMYVGDLDAIEWLNKVLETFGLETESKQRRVNGDQVRFYRVVMPDYIPTAIANLEKRLEKAQKDEQVLRIEAAIDRYRYTLDVLESVTQKFEKQASESPKNEQKNHSFFGVSNQPQTQSDYSFEGVTSSTQYIYKPVCDSNSPLPTGLEDIDLPSEPAPVASIPVDLPRQKSPTRVLIGSKVKWSQMAGEWEVKSLGTATACLIRGCLTFTGDIKDLEAIA